LLYHKDIQQRMTQRNAKLLCFREKKCPNE
jgi:hypothetical protein